MRPLILIRIRRSVPAFQPTLSPKSSLKDWETLANADRSRIASPSAPTIIRHTNNSVRHPETVRAQSGVLSQRSPAPCSRRRARFSDCQHGQAVMLTIGRLRVSNGGTHLKLRRRQVARVSSLTAQVPEPQESILAHPECRSPDQEPDCDDARQHRRQGQDRLGADVGE